MAEILEQVYKVFASVCMFMCVYIDSRCEIYIYHWMVLLRLICRRALSNWL